MYAQRDEESHIFKLEGTGTFLDIGAYDGKTFSNTRALAEEGWSGVCVEPAAAAFAKMVEDPPPGAKLIHALIGPTTGLCSFLHSRDAVSTSDRAHARRWQGAVAYTPIFTVSVTLDDLLKDFPGPYRLISIDTEGTSSFLARSLVPRLDDLDTEMLIYEHDGDFIHIDGWKEVYRSPENVILRRCE